MDSGALYDLLYSNAPEIFSRYRFQKALSILALVRLRAVMYSDMEVLLKMGNMNLFATKYPYTCNPADVLECQKQIRK